MEQQWMGERFHLDSSKDVDIAVVIDDGSNKFEEVLLDDTNKAEWDFVCISESPEQSEHTFTRCYHNGLDVLTDADVDESYAKCLEQAEKWGLHDITKPSERHGTYSFLFWDNDENAWEILSNPKGGYTGIFEQGDLVGKGHFSQGFRENRPDTKDH